MSSIRTIFPKRLQDKTHLRVQKTLLSLLPQARLEHRFPSINRIADVVLPSHKIIFEIQCSPISLEEAQNRIRDYASLDFTVIWILHHRHFNAEVVSPAELYLRKRPAYFTSITPHGYGFFYDQLEIFKGLCRVYKSPPLILEGMTPRHLTHIPRTFPKGLKKKLAHTPLYLPGDLTDNLLTSRRPTRWAKMAERKHSTTAFRKFISLFKDFFLYLLYLNADRPH